MTPFQVVTFADKEPTAPYFFFREFKQSLARYGIEPIMLGWNQQWRGLGSKPKLLKEAITNGTITADIIIVTDSFDVVFAAHPEAIVRWGLERPEHIVWNAEKSCWPDATLADRHPPSDTPWRYLNSGLAVGHTMAFYAALEHMKADEIPDDHRAPDGRMIEPNDQLLWQHEFMSNYVRMDLDTRCEVFQTFHATTQEEMDFSGDRIRNAVTGTYPVALHLNGAKEPWRDKVLTKLGL